jgi:hypothetical protein
MLDVAVRSRGRAQTVAAGLLSMWTMMLLTWPSLRRTGEPLSANGLMWVAYRQPQPLHWLGENIYVPVTLATMLLAAWWLRHARGEAAESQPEAIRPSAPAAPAGLAS